MKNRLPARLSFALIGLLVAAGMNPVYASQAAPAASQESTSLLELPTTNLPSGSVSATPPPAIVTPVASAPSHTPTLTPDAANLNTVQSGKGSDLPSAMMPATDSIPTDALPTLPALPEANTVPENSAVSVRTLQVYPPKILSIPGFPAMELLEEPMRFDEGLSLMFPEKDMFSLVIPSLALFDKAGRKIENNGNNQVAETDDLTGLLESLEAKGTTKEVVQPLPNIYLGSIVYYSAANWSIWLNGKKVTNAYNAAANPLYVQSINRSQVKLVWKPSSMMALNKILNEKKNASPDYLVVDESKGVVTVTLRPNQTFVPSLLAVLEGLVKQAEPVIPPQPSATDTSVASPASASPMLPGDQRSMKK